ncbi:MAG TPA: TIM barrel protein, partial [Caldilineaceae bacterium]|nr:TIM barrel protein [Caldilineaceae bacterium]
FVKPWKSLSLPALARHVRALGFTWIELPVRPGFPCQPDCIEQTLPEAVRVLAEEGVRVLNVTVDLPLDDERLYAACAAAEVTLNRVMFRTGKRPYWEAEAAARRQLDAALPLCERYGVRIGVQNHVGDFVGVHEFGLYHLLDGYDRRYVGAIWDAAHNALAGMEPEPALDVVADMLFIVNLKNGYWRRINGPEAELAEWKCYWTSGRQGRASWPRVVAKLKAMGYTGPICLTAEYSDEHAVDRLIAEDLAFARGLLST